MPLEGTLHIGRRDSGAIVGYLDELAPPFTNVDVNRVRARVQGVFYELFNHRSRSFHDLAGGDLRGQLIW